MYLIIISSILVRNHILLRKIECWLMLQLMSEGIEEFPLMFLVKNNCFIKDKVQYPKPTQVCKFV